MADATGIEWTDATWTPVTGCTRVSEGCRNCYAERMARRLDGRRVGYDGTTVATERGPRWSGKVNLHPERLEQPLRWRKPRRVFVCSMSDLFHPDVPFEFIDRVFAVMALARDHTFQVLTKRPERMAEYTTSAATSVRVLRLCALILKDVGTASLVWEDDGLAGILIPHVWLGTSCEDQATADERIPHLLRCPAAVRFVSCEPLLSRIEMGPYFCCDFCGYTRRDAQEQMDHDLCPGGQAMPVAVDWVIAGGESGPGARRCDIGWLRDIVRQCRSADVPVFVKQLGAKPAGFSVHEIPGYPQSWPHDSKGGDPSEWPEDLRVRQMPECAT